ncbi:hypothetical protein ACVGXE_00055, partial [Escherichia coli]
LVFVACCVCLFKKIPQTTTVGNPLARPKIKTEMVIAHLSKRAGCVFVFIQASKILGAFNSMESFK